MNIKTSIAVFFLTTASVLMLLPVTDANIASAQSAGNLFNPLSGGSSFSSLGASSASEASLIFGTAPANGFFVPGNSSFLPVSTSTASASIANGNMTCSGAACVNVSATCSLSLIYTRTARLNDTGIDVVALQKYLEKVGLLIIPDGTTYGFFGGKTQAALMLFQATAGLQTTGILDLETRNALNSKVFNGDECYAFVRYDSLQFTLSAKAKRATVASNLNSLGITSAGNRPYCLTTGVLTYSCFNIASTNSFIGYLPNKTSAVRSALYLATFTDRFSKVDYVPSDPQSALGSIVFIGKTTTTTTTTTTTRVSADGATTTTSTATSSTATSNQR